MEVSMSSHEPLVLPSGTPVIVVQTLIDCDECDGNPLADLPKVYAGRLSEPYPLEKGIAPALLLEGPMARSIAGNAFGDRVVLWNEAGDALLIFFSPEKTGVQPYHWVFEDKVGLVDEAEAATPMDWRTAEDFRQRLYRHVMEAFALHLSNIFATPFGYGV